MSEAMIRLLHSSYAPGYRVIHVSSTGEIDNSGRHARRRSSSALGISDIPDELTVSREKDRVGEHRCTQQQH